MFLNGATVDLVRFERNRFQEVDGGRSVTGIRNMGNGVWRVLARSAGNGDDQAGWPDNFNITVIGNDAFRIENNMEQHYTHCPRSTVPKTLREDWFEF